MGTTLMDELWEGICPPQTLHPLLLLQENDWLQLLASRCMRQEAPCLRHNRDETEPLGLP